MPRKRLSKSSLLWFIRSRSYVSIPDIRRRFNLESGNDVTPIVCQQGRVYVGLPSDAARVLGDLVREGRVGLELQPGLMARVAIGAYVIPHARNHAAAERLSSETEGPSEEEGDESPVASLR